MFRQGTRRNNPGLLEANFRISPESGTKRPGVVGWLSEKQPNGWLQNYTRLPRFPVVFLPGEPIALSCAHYGSAPTPKTIKAINRSRHFPDRSKCEAEGWGTAQLDHPPLVTDFWCDSVARDVLQPASRRAVRVRGEQFAVPI
jgi:hypothetical protein